MVLLLRHRGRLTADELARELEVSTRTVLRDVEALSTAGVPVYAERGRHGGFELLPGFRSELTGLTHDEALALVVAGSRRGAAAFGLGPALAAAMLKVVDALPMDQQAQVGIAAARILVDPDSDLLERPNHPDDGDDEVLAEVRRAVVRGRRVRFRYAAVGDEPRWRVVDPIGLVTVKGQGYLLATRDGAERTYRLSRVAGAEMLEEPAERPGQVDLGAAWKARGHRFRRGAGQVEATVRVDGRGRELLSETVLAVIREETHDEDVVMDVVLQDRRHALWAMWQLGSRGRVIQPEWLREELAERALAMARSYAPSHRRSFQ